MNNTPTNLDLAREAVTSKDCARQVELSSHPSEVVRAALLRNKSLCDEAMEALSNEVDALRKVTLDQIDEV